MLSSQLSPKLFTYMLFFLHLNIQNNNISFIDFVIVSSNANTECLIKPHLTGTFNNKYFIHIHMFLKIAIALIDGFV